MIKNRLFQIIYIVIISCVFFVGLDSGTPDKGRVRLVFKNQEELDKYIPVMIEMREKYYSSLKKIYNDKTDIKESIANTFFHNLKSSPFKEIEKRVILDAVRGYLLGNLNNDEQHTLVGVSNINPLKFDFNPDDYIYGGFYFYSAGGMLIAGKLFKKLSLVRDVKFYLKNPDEVKMMYFFIRLLSAISITGTIILLFLIFKSQYGERITFISILYFSLAPLVLLNSHIAKPHAYGLFWIVLGLLFLLKTLKKQELTNYIFAGLSFGLAASCLITNWISILLLFIFEYFNTKKIWTRNIFISLFFSVSIFFLINHYILYDFNSFLRKCAETKILWGYSVVNPVESLRFLEDCLYVIGPFMLPLIITGFIKILRQKNIFTYILLVFILVQFIINFIFFKHINLFMITMIFISLCFSEGFYCFLDKIKRKNILSNAIKFYLFLCIFSTVIKGIHFEKIYSMEGNLRESGKWINNNIKENSGIGIVNGWFTPGDTPPFNFLNYRLINIPVNLNSLNENKNDLPEYIVINDNNIKNMNHKLIENYYELVKEFKRKYNFLTTPYIKRYIPTENIGILIYKLK